MKLIYKYDAGFESWLFATEKEALDWINKYTAFFEATTWGEFRAIFPKEDYEWISNILIERQFEDETYVPKDSDSFLEHQEFPFDADYPEFLIFQNGQYFPKEIISKYGEEIITMHDGVYVRFPKECIEELYSELESKGFELELRDHLNFEGS